MECGGGGGGEREDVLVIQVDMRECLSERESVGCESEGVGSESTLVGTSSIGFKIFDFLISHDCQLHSWGEDT